MEDLFKSNSQQQYEIYSPNPNTLFTNFDPLDSIPSSEWDIPDFEIQDSLPTYSTDNIFTSPDISSIDISRSFDLPNFGSTPPSSLEFPFFDDKDFLINYNQPQQPWNDNSIPDPLTGTVFQGDNRSNLEVNISNTDIPGPNTQRPIIDLDNTPPNNIEDFNTNNGGNFNLFTNPLDLNPQPSMNHAEIDNPLFQKEVGTC